MKNNLFKVLLSVICMAGVLIACNDDDYNGPSPDEITANYSNKLAVGDRANLDLIYSGREFIGKEVNFNTSDSKAATITLKSILPGETLTPIENVQLTADGNNGYTFSGSGTGTSGTTFNYQGVINKEKLSLTLSDVKQPANQLAQHGTFYPVQTGSESWRDPELKHYYTLLKYALHLVSDDKSLAQAATLLEAIAGNILTWFVSDITFQPDGNITARYAPGLPDGKAITDILMAQQNRPDSDWVASPVNLASYYVKDDSVVYIVPNIDMIIREIEQNKATKAATDSILTEENLTAVYQKLQQWATKGIKFTARKHSGEMVIFSQTPTMTRFRGYKGDLFLFIDKNEIKEFLPLLPLVKELIPEDMLSGPLGGMLNNMLNGIINGINNSNLFELGLMLTKEKDIPDAKAASNAEMHLSRTLSPILNDKSKSN